MKCVFTRKRKLLSRLIEHLQRIDNISSKILSITMSTLTSSIEHCEYMTQRALQHIAEPDTSFLYFSLLSNLCSTSLRQWWLMADDCCAETGVNDFSLLLNLTCDNNANKTVDSFEELNEGPS